MIHAAEAPRSRNHSTPSRGPTRWLCIGARVACLALLLSGPLDAAPRQPTASDIAAIFRSFRADLITLAPDGRHLAYTLREGQHLFLRIVDVDHPETKAIIVVGGQADAGTSRRSGHMAAQVTFLRWVTPARLVYAMSAQNEVRVVDADGKNDRKLVDQNDLEEYLAPSPYYTNPRPPATPQLIIPEAQFIPRPPRVLGLLADDTDAIAVEAIGGQIIKSEVFKVSLSSGKPESLHREYGNTRPRSPFLHDRQAYPRILDYAPEDSQMVTPVRAVQVASQMSGGEPLIPEPRAFHYQPAKESGRWQSLDKFLGQETALSFRHSPAEFYGQRSFPLAFDADPNLLYFASNVGRDTYALYALDLRTRKRTDFAVEDPAFDVVDAGDALTESALVFDRAHRLAGVRLPGLRPTTRWFDPELARIQGALDGLLTERTVKILEWDDARRRVLLLVTSATEPGRYYIYQDGQPGRLTEFLRRAPWLNADRLNRAEPFAFTTPTGVALTGTITLPRVSRLPSPPLLLLCRELPGQGANFGFDRSAQVLADMGFAVAQVNYRGTAGFGARHRDAVKEGYDRIPIEDLRAAVGWIAAHH
ncbi:MAG: prolyl oligopeptidase family serine peptidase [Opitutae bacterium]|nr:prolyl oligopeptidase family serine peptidase [Opitutae bacterium]